MTSSWIFGWTWDMFLYTFILSHHLVMLNHSCISEDGSYQTASLNNLLIHLDMILRFRP